MSIESFQQKHHGATMTIQSTAACHPTILLSGRQSDNGKSHIRTLAKLTAAKTKRPAFIVSPLRIASKGRTTAYQAAQKPRTGPNTRTLGSASEIRTAPHASHTSAI